MAEWAEVQPLYPSNRMPQSEYQSPRLLLQEPQHVRHDSPRHQPPQHRYDMYGAGASQQQEMSRPGQVLQLPPINRSGSMGRQPPRHAYPQDIGDQGSESRRAWGNETYLPRKLNVDNSANLYGEPLSTSHPQTSIPPQERVQPQDTHDFSRVDPRSYAHIPSEEHGHHVDTPSAHHSRSQPRIASAPHPRPPATPRPHGASSMRSTMIDRRNPNLAQPTNTYPTTIDSQLSHDQQLQSSRPQTSYSTYRPKSATVESHNGPASVQSLEQPIHNEINQLKEVIRKQNESVDALRKEAESANQKLELEATKKELNELTLRVDAATTLATTTKKQLEEMGTAKSEVDISLQEHRSKLEALTKKLAEAEEGRRSSESSFSNLDDKFQNLTLEASGLKAEVSRLQDLLARAEKARDADTAAASVLRERISELMVKLSTSAKIETEKAQALSSLALVDSECSKLKLELESTKVQLLNSNSSKEELSKLITQQEKNIETKTALLETKESEASAAQAEKKELGSALEEAKTSTEFWKSKSEELDSKLADFQSQLERIKKDTKQGDDHRLFELQQEKDKSALLESEIQKLQVFLDDNKNDSKKQLDVMRENLEDFEEQNLGFQARLLDKDGEIARLTQVINSLREQSSDPSITQEYTPKKSAAQEFSALVDKLTREKRDLQGKLHNAQETSKNLQQQLNTLVKSQEITAIKNDTPDEHVKQSSSDNNDLVITIEELQADLARERAAKEVLEDRLAKAEGDLQSVVEVSNKSTEEELDTKKPDLQSFRLKQEIDDAKTRAEKSLAALGALEEKYAAVSAALLRAEAESSRVQSDLKEATAQLSIAQEDNGTSQIYEEFTRVKREKILLEKKLSDGYLSPKDISDLRDEYARKLLDLGTQAQKDRSSAKQAREEARIATEERTLQHGRDEIAISALTSERDMLKEKLEVMTDRVEELAAAGAAAAKLYVQISELEKNVEELKATIGERDTAIESLRDEVIQVKEEAQEEIERKTRDVAGRMQFLEESKVRLEADVKQKSQQLAEAQMSLKTMTQALEKSETEAKMLRLGVEKADALHQKQIDVLKAGIDQYESTLKKIGQLLGIDLIIEENEITETDFDPADEDEVIRGRWESQIDAPLTKIDEQVGALNEKMEQLKNTIEEVRATEAQERKKLIEKHTTIVDKLKKKLDRKEQILKETADELGKTKTELNTKIARRENDDAEHDRLIDEVTRLKDKLEQQRSEINKLRGELTDEMQLKEALAKRVELRTKSLAAPKVIRSECYAELQDVKEKLKRVEGNAKVKISAKNALLNELRSSVAAKDDELERTKALLELAQDRVEHAVESRA